MKATPIRELKRRKLEDMVGMLKFGRSTYVRERRSLMCGVFALGVEDGSEEELSATSSVGRTCESRLMMLVSFRLSLCLKCKLVNSE
jgi:hypothetical protein